MTAEAPWALHNTSGFRLRWSYCWPRICKTCKSILFSTLSLCSSWFVVVGWILKRAAFGAQCCWPNRECVLVDKNRIICPEAEYRWAGSMWESDKDLLRECVLSPVWRFFFFEIWLALWRRHIPDCTFVKHRYLRGRYIHTRSAQATCLPTFYFSRGHTLRASAD